MTKPIQADNYTALQWVVDELKLEVGQALRCLEDYVEEDSDQEKLDECVHHLSQVAGIFSVTGVAIPSLLCTELQQLAKSYQDIENVPNDECLGVLAEAILSVGSYLNNPVPGSVKLVGQINNVRALLDREMLSESSIFEPNIEAGLRAFKNRSAESLDSKTLRKLRMLFQKSMLSVIKNGVSEDALAGMQKVFKVLYQLSGTAYLSALGYSCSALADRLVEGQVGVSTAIKSTFKRIDEVLRKEISEEPSEDVGLLKNVLFYVALGSSHTGTSEKVVKAFSLKSYTDDGKAENQGGHSGLEPELVAKVVEAVQTEIEQAKTWLDNCLHQTCDFQEAIENVDSIMKRTDDTLVMINTEEPRRTTKQLIEVLGSWSQYQDETAIHPDELDQFATAMVHLENDLISLTDTKNGGQANSSSYGQATATILAESRASLTHIKNSISRFIESGVNWDALDEVPANLTMVEGALRFYPLEDLANVVNCTRRYVRESLLSQKRTPEQAEIDLFADVVVAIDYYLECLERGTAFNLDFLIERALDNCAKLGFPLDGEDRPTPEFSGTEEIAETVAEIETSATNNVFEIGTAAAGASTEDTVVEPIAASAPVEQPEPTTEVDEPDDEIIEIFVEEAEEILPEATKQLTAWRDSEDHAALLDLRRGFHTLKGGGRMVNATHVGELSWAMEDMLNRVIDKTIEPSAKTYDVIEQSLLQYPVLLEALRTGNKSDEPQEVANLRVAANELSDPNAQIEEQPVENSELTQTFIREAEELREKVVEHTAMLSGDEPEIDVSEKLLFAFHTLTESARNVEFEDIADSLKPLQQLLRHYSSVEEKLSSDFITILNIWSGKFSECLESLRVQGSINPAGLKEVSEQCVQLLHKEEKELALHSDNRKKRFRPLHRLMAEELEQIIVAEQIIRDWQIGQAQPAKVNGLIDDLNTLSETAEMCKVVEISELCALLAAFQSQSSPDFQLEDEKANYLLEGYERLLELLDAVAAWLVIPKVPQQVIDNLEGNLVSITEQETAPDSIVNLVDTQPEEPIIPEATETVSETPEAVESVVTEETSQEEELDALEGLDELLEEPVAEETQDFGSNEAFSQPDESFDEDDDFERELMETFLEEGDELVRDLDISLKAWRETPTNYNHADSIHRALHTLKGGARLSGLPELGNMSHDFESFVIDQQVNQNADDDFFRSALTRLDKLNEHLEAVRQSSQTPGPVVEPTAASFEPETEAVSETPAPAPEKPETTPVESAEKAEEKPVVKKTAKPKAKKAEQPKEETAPVAAAKPATLTAKTLEEAAADALKRDLRQETVRLRTDALDEMVNLASESTVYRGRIEAQLNSIDSQLDELEATIDRIQGLARRLDVETEAQINFRSEQIAESDGEEDFDPLEMDRYSALQQLSRQLIESASDLQDLRTTLSEGTRDTSVLVIQSSRILNELNDQLMTTRMVPFTQLVPRLERITRQVSRELAKEVELTALNIEGEVDRQIMEKILPPLEHIIRNSVDHGIEDVASREANGKESRGHIYLNVRREGSYTVIRVADDGGGINLDAVRKRAVNNGLIGEAESYALGKDSLLEFLFSAGFSTASSVTQISGRGVGMDVVRSTLQDMGGNISIETEEGKGTAFELSIPFTLSVNRALMVHSGEDTYALPMSSLEALVRINKDELAAFYKGDRKTLKYGTDEYEFGYLGELLQTLERPQLDTILDPTITLALFRSGHHRIALMMDEITGSQEVVVKSLGSPFQAVDGISGASVMGDGSVVVALDMPTLINSYYKLVATGNAIQIDAAEAQTTDRAPVVMVVDDSVTVRKVTSRFLNRQGYVVEAARDGVEALRLIHDQTPDLMLVDVEMPRMDGFELLGILRSTDKFKELPVFLITSRTGAKHRERGLSLGAQRYFGKPYREDELIEAMNEYL